MKKPYLIVITGRPASGKTTLAHILSKVIKCPLLSRDELKEGYLNTFYHQHSQIDKSIDWHIYDTFFETINLLISKSISIIAEAAFQHKLWTPKLSDFLGKAEVRIIVCGVSSDLAKYRFTNRLLANPDREKFHGDKPIILPDDRNALLIEAYETINIEAPILKVDTTENYNPKIENIINFIMQRSC